MGGLHRPNALLHAGTVATGHLVGSHLDLDVRLVVKVRPPQHLALVHVGRVFSTHKVLKVDAYLAILTLLVQKEPRVLLM